MSATPHEEELRRQIVMHIHAEDELAKARRFIVDLLAVAKAYAGTHAIEDGSLYAYCAKCRQPDLDVLHSDGCPVAPLDAAHPGWREWTP